MTAPKKLENKNKAETIWWRISQVIAFLAIMSFVASDWYFGWNLMPEIPPIQGPD